MLGLSLFGSFMIASAEMGNAAGQTDALTKSISKQVLIVAIGLIGYIICSRIKPFSKTFTIGFYKVLYFIVIFFLLIPRLFGAINGAYAWIRIGFISIQPSEFAKVFSIIFGAKLLGLDRKEKNLKYIKQFILSQLVIIAIIYAYQRDFGTAVVLFGIDYLICFVTYYKGMAKFHNIMSLVTLAGIVIVLIIFSPGVTSFLENYTGNYRIARIVSSANPFTDQYNTGYHLVMSLVSFATGGWIGLGYGQSVHKYMNFPNPSTDFILPVIVEETGIIGFTVICILYIGIMVMLALYSFRSKTIRGKILYFGTFAYFFIHFIFNVGGVSGLIPLTGVPLLMLSSGGSSTIASMVALGFCQSMIITENNNESNSGEIQEI